MLASREVAIGREENARRTVTYTNIVRDIVAVQTGATKPSAHHPHGQFKNYDSVVVLLQAGSIDRPGDFWRGADESALGDRAHQTRVGKRGDARGVRISPLWRRVRVRSPTTADVGTSLSTRPPSGVKWTWFVTHLIGL